MSWAEKEIIYRQVLIEELRDLDKSPNPSDYSQYETHELEEFLSKGRNLERQRYK